MNGARALLPLFAAASLLLGLVVCDLAERQTFPQPAAVAAMGLAFGQISLSAAWLVYSRWNIVLRMLLMLAVVSWWRGPISDVTGQSSVLWMSVLLGHAAMFGAVAWGARIWGVGVAHAAPAGGQPLARARAARWQFGLWDVLSCVTAICLLLAVVRLLEFPLAVVGRAAVFCLGMTLAALVAAWAAARSRCVLGAAAALIVPFFIGAPMAAVGIPPQPMWSVAAMTGLEGLYVACGAAVLQMSGYWVGGQPLLAAPPEAAGRRIMASGAGRHPFAGCGTPGL